MKNFSTTKIVIAGAALSFLSISFYFKVYLEHFGIPDFSPKTPTKLQLHAVADGEIQLPDLFEIVRTPDYDSNTSKNMLLTDFVLRPETDGLSLPTNFSSRRVVFWFHPSNISSQRILALAFSSEHEIHVYDGYYTTGTLADFEANEARNACWSKIPDIPIPSEVDGQ